MDDVVAWSASWAWSLPLIVLNVTFHVIGLGIIHSKGVQILSVVKDHRHFLSMFALVMGVTAILVTVLHALEAGIWAAAFRLLGALPDGKSAILYSLGALTTFGHSELFLAAHWRLMGVSGGAEWHDPVRAHDGVSLRHDPARVARRSGGEVGRQAVVAAQACGRGHGAGI